MKYSWYKNFAIWLAKSIFDLAQSKIYNFSFFFFFFFESISTCHKSSLFILFWDTADLRILQSDWLRTLWLTTLEREFSQIWDLYRRHKANNTRSGKKTTFWKKLLKSLLSVILHIFGEKKYFSWKIGLSFFRIHNYLHYAKYQKKVMNGYQVNFQPDWLRDRQTTVIS